MVILELTPVNGILRSFSQCPSRKWRGARNSNGETRDQHYVTAARIPHLELAAIIMQYRFIHSTVIITEHWLGA